MSDALLDGGCQVFGSSYTKVDVGISLVPSEARTLKASTRNPLTLPSVWLKRKLTVFAPVWTTPAGRFMVIFRVLNPPPIPPYAEALPKRVTVPSLIGIQPELFT